MAQVMRERTSPRTGKDAYSPRDKVLPFLPSFVAEAWSEQGIKVSADDKDATSTTGALELIHLQASPWSLRARWVLKYHGIAYSASTYAPILGTLYESFDIAQWCDDHSNRSDGARLLPTHQLDQIKRWNDASDRICAHLRSEAFEAAQKDEAFKLKVVPQFLLSMPGGRAVALGVADTVLGRMALKYKDTSDASSLQQAQELLREFRGALSAAGGRYLLGAFSYADILLAIVLQSLCPPGQHRTLPADRTTVPFVSQELHEELQDLIPWADGIFDKHFS